MTRVGRSLRLLRVGGVNVALGRRMAAILSMRASLLRISSRKSLISL